MTIRKYSSRAQQTTLQSAIASGDTTMTVGSATTLLGGITVTAGTTFTVAIDPDTALEEIVDVTAVSSNTLTITRGIDGSSATAHSAGAAVRHMAIGRDYREANAHVEETTTAHGLTLADVITTTNTKTLTNKTLTSPKINENVAVTATATELNILDGVTSSTAELNLLDGVTTSTTELNYVDGVTSPIQSQLDAKQAVVSGVSDTEIGYLDGVTSAIQTQLNAKAPLASPTFTGTVTLPDSTVTSAMIANATIVNADVSGTAAISKTKLDLGGTITSADLVDGTIVAADIADGTITAAKMVSDPYARANHTGSQTASTISDFNTAVRTNRLDQMATPTASVAMGSQKITGLADPTSAQDAVTIAYITAQKGAVSGLASLDSSGLIPQSQIPGIALHTTTVVNSQSAMLAISGADAGDIAVRTDVNKTFVLTASPASTLGNWQELLTPTDAVTSVDGNTGAITLSGTYLAKAGGTMTGDLTLAGAPSSNLHAATKAYVDTVAGSATAAAASAAAAAASYDSFDDRYLGSKSSAPSVDNDGNALVEGALYWNSVDNAMYAWTGTEWGSISSTAEIYRFRFTAAGGETSISGLDDNGLTLSYLPGKEQVYLNGVLLVRTTDYTASNGTSLTSLAALAASDIVEVITFTSFEVADAIARTVFDAKGDILVGTAADTVGKLTVGTNGYALMADSSTATGLKWGAVSVSPLTNTGADTGDTIYSGSTTPSSPTTGDIWIDDTASTDPDLTTMTIMGAY